MDRVAQMVVKMQLESKIEPLLHEDSFGYQAATLGARCLRAKLDKLEDSSGKMTG